VTYECGLPVPGTTGVPQPGGAPGGLTVLDWAGFQGAVSYTFDDTTSSQIEHYGELQALGVPMTFYLITSGAQASNEVWAQAVADGHELGNHSHTHPQNASAMDIDTAEAFLESQFGIEVWTMAAPYGNASYIPLGQERYLINRGVSNQIILPNDDANPFDLPCYVPPTGASADVMFSQVTSARDAGGWRVVLLHGFTGGSGGAYQPVGIDQFVSSVQQAKDLGDMWLDTVVAVGAYWRAQRMLSEVTPEQAGDAQTWSWTLPDHFPPGRCLRVTVSGGTVSQGGEPLAWDDHGYYEISLDAGAVTVGP